MKISIFLFACGFSLAQIPEPVPTPHLPPLPPEPRAAAMADMAAKLHDLSARMAFGFQARDVSRDRSDRQYERGERALDQRKWDEAVTYFGDVASAGQSRADAALYWKAYALGKLGRTAEATAELDSLAKNYKESRWLGDAKALRVELAQAAGKPLAPEDAADDELKLMAINSLMNSEPERSIPLLEKLLQKQSSPKLRERALFVLSQSNSPQAREVVVRVAKGGSNPDLQRKAVRSLGIHGGKENRQVLAEIYSSSNDVPLKKEILKGFMVSGERDRILSLAKSEQNPELRMQAIQLLGVMGVGAPLADLYASESSPDVKRRILQALFVQGDAKPLIAIARKEQDPSLKKRAVEHLSHMKSKEATDYLMELLK